MPDRNPTTCIQYTYSHREGGGELTREAIVHKAGGKYNMTDCISSL
jgi:hypothetical protein